MPALKSPGVNPRTPRTIEKPLVNTGGNAACCRLPADVPVSPLAPGETLFLDSCDRQQCCQRSSRIVVPIRLDFNGTQVYLQMVQNE